MDEKLDDHASGPQLPRFGNSLKRLIRSWFTFVDVDPKRPLMGIQTKLLLGLVVVDGVIIMCFQAELILGLAVVDAVIIAVFYLWLRSTPPMDEMILSAIRTGLFMFLVQAILCFGGALLILQLATIAVLFALSSLQHAGKFSKASVVASKW